MNCFLIFLIFFFKCFFLHAEDYIMEGFFKMNITGNITMENKASYRTISLEGMWKDNLGQIGLFEAYGKVDKLSTEPNIEAVGYGRSEFNEEFWFMAKRNKKDLDVGGGGVLQYIEGTGRYKKLVGLKCPYVARYMEGRNFHISKCKINKNLLEELKNFK